MKIVNEKTGSQDVINQSLAIASVAVVLAAVAASVSCVSKGMCMSDNTCEAVVTTDLRLVPACSVRKIVSVFASDYSNATSALLASLLRAYCVVGERIGIGADGATTVCSPHFPYPLALNSEIQLSSGDTDAQKACGRWIGSTSLLQSGAEYFSFSGSSAKSAAIRSAVAKQSSSLVASTNIGKFRSACESVVLGGHNTINVDAMLAYQHLITYAELNKLKDLESDALSAGSGSTTSSGTDSDVAKAALAALGKIVGHYCDAPLTIGWDFARGATIGVDRALITSFYNGALFSSGALAEALTLVGAESTLVAESKVQNDVLNNAAQSSSTINSPDSALEAVFEGATNRTDHSDMYFVKRASTFPAFDGFHYLATDHMSSSYLKGVAAICAFSMQTAVRTGTIGNTYGSLRRLAPIASADLERRRAGLPRASGLHRIKADPNGPAMLEIDSAAMLNATHVTMSQITSLQPQAYGSAMSQCTEFARALFVDDSDAFEFNMVINGAFYERMRVLVERVRAAVVSTFTTNTVIRGVLLDPSPVIAAITSTRVRIPGAPRGTWAGASRDMPSAEFDAADGVFTMALKQARNVFLDRQKSMIFDAKHVCESMTTYDALDTNAYIYTSNECTFYLLGMSMRPFADIEYDDESLFSRMGYIIAHELSHLTLRTAFNVVPLAALLSRYDPSTFDEAIADVAAGVALVESGLVDGVETFCSHVSQIWCARTSASYDLSPPTTHPKANVRGDRLCETLREIM